MKKDILFIAATHGDEPIGVEVMENLKAQGFAPDQIIGNPKALFERKRYIEADLNRSSPGNLQSSILEVRRAAEIIQLSKNYQYTIDIHGSSKETGIFTLITNPTMDNFKLASMLDIKRIVIWPSLTPEQEGPLSEYFDCGLEIECGKKDDPKIRARLENILTNFIKKDLRADADWRERLEARQIFEMYGSLKRSDCKDIDKLSEFAETTINGESFYPIFVGSYDYEDVICYKLRLANSAQIASLQ